MRPCWPLSRQGHAIGMMHQDKVFPSQGRGLQARSSAAPGGGGFLRTKEAVRTHTPGRLHGDMQPLTVKRHNKGSGVRGWLQHCWLPLHNKAMSSNAAAEDSYTQFIDLILEQEPICTLCSLEDIRGGMSPYRRHRTQLS